VRAYVENGAELTREFGDIDETIYHSLESVLNELAQLLWVRAKRCIPSSGSGFSGWQRSRKTSAGAMAIPCGTKCIDLRTNRQVNSR